MLGFNNLQPVKDIKINKNRSSFRIARYLAAKVLKINE